MGLCVSKLKVRGTANRHFTEEISPTQPNSTLTQSTPQPSGVGLYFLDNLPRRARKKAEDLIQAVENSDIARTNPQLAHYADVVLRIVGYSAPTPEVSTLDAENLPILVESYNKRYPNLNLTCFDDPRVFLSHLWQSSESSWRALVKLGNSHRVAVDIRTYDDGRKTLLIMESARAHGLDQENNLRFTTGIEYLHENIATYFQGMCHMSIIDVAAQKSMIGCMSYALNFAINSHHNAAFFDSLHARLHDSGRCFNDEDGKSEVLKGMEFVEGEQVLPALFYKHAQSRGTINSVLQHQPHLADADVRTNRSEPAETLDDRARAFRITRDDLSYSMSIEASRMRKIRNAIENDP